MTVVYMRDYIKKAYDYSENWCKKVDKMNDNQVIAIYYRLLNSPKKKIEPVKKVEEVKKEEKPKKVEYHQITMYEYLHGLV